MSNVKRYLAQISQISCILYSEQMQFPYFFIIKLIWLIGDGKPLELK